MKRGDRIDLSLIDADPFTDGDQAFQRGAASTAEAGEARLARRRGQGRDAGAADADGDGAADMEIRVTGEVRHWDFVW